MLGVARQQRVVAVERLSEHEEVVLALLRGDLPDPRTEVGPEAVLDVLYGVDPKAVEVDPLDPLAEDLHQREERLGRLIGLLLEGEEALSGVAVQEFRGVLDWPTEGRIVEEFGLRQDPRYKTLVPYNGVGILPRHTPAEVRPVYRGKVLYAAPFQGFGLTVVVSHSGGILSLYAGLDDLRVGKGDVVSLRSLLGTTTARLYFEIRDGNRPVNPRGWLR